MNRAHLIAEIRARLKRYPPPDDAHYGVVPLPPPDGPIQMGPAQSDHSAALRALGRADALAAQYPSHFLLSRVLVRQEAVASSDIEGTHSTLDALLEVEETDAADATTADILVRDYALTLEGALVDVERNGSEAFTVHTIEKLHRALMMRDKMYAARHGSPGEFRRKQVRIGGTNFSNSTFNPPPHSYVLACVAEQIAYLRCDGLQQIHQSVVTQLAIAHAHFEAVHPFPDGNGRVGRLLLPLMLRAAGHTPLYLAPYIAAFKPDYYDALRAAQQRMDFVPLIGHLSRAIVSAVDDADSMVTRLEVLQGDWLQRKKIRKNSAAHKMISMLAWHPVLTAGTVQRLIGVSHGAANTAIKQLLEVGILTLRSPHKKKNRVFRAREVLEIYKNPNCDVSE